jgi:hypothetical protein
MSTLYDRVRLAREGAEVERAHAHPHLMRYSVGHHSLSLVTLITLCWMEDHGGRYPSAALLVAAAFHDIPERITGDVPQPVKALLGGKLEAVEDRVLEYLGVDAEIGLTPEELLYLHKGDKLELWLWCWEETLRGNSNFQSWIADYNESDVWTDAPPAYKQLIRHVTFGGLPRLEFYGPGGLKEIAGL